MKIVPDTKILVTGAASGIGRATSLALADRGARLAVTDIRGPGLEETAAMIKSRGGRVLSSRALDISCFEEVKAFAAEVHRDHGAVDILMNIAGISVWSLVENMTHDHWVRVINTNLWGPIHGIECFVPEMIKAGRGHVVTVSSISGLLGLPWHGAYAASKYGCVGLSEVLRYDLRQHNIGVTVVCPGAVETPLKNTVELLGVDQDAESVKALKRRFSQRAIPPEKVARQILKAVETGRFLVITSFDVRLMYFLKRYLPPAYHRLLLYASRLLNSVAVAA